MSKKKIVITIVVIIFLLLIGGIVGFTAYYIKMTDPVSSENESIVVTIPEGASSSAIGKILSENKLIKSEFVFKLYAKLNGVSDMMAGNHKLNKTMSLSQIIESLQKGDNIVKETVNITFLEGKNMRWLAKKIADNTKNTEEDVYNTLVDENYLNSLIKNYWFIDESIKNTDIYYSLEGYLFPDTYNVKIESNVQEIFNVMLIQMQKKLEPYKEKIQSSNISVHKLLTIASIIEMEASKDEDRSGVSSVIYNRLKNNMSIGSDVTTYYAIKVEPAERDLYKSELDSKNPYNTRGPNMNGKLPVGPISSVGSVSIDAALNPNQSNYLYFVADKNGKLYFAETLQEHNRNISYLQSQGLWYSYE